MYEAVWTIILSLLGVIGLIFLAYAGTKWLNKKFRYGGLYGAAKGIKVIESVGIAPDKQLIAVKVGKRHMLLGVTPASVSKICDLDDGDIEEFEQPDGESSGFLNTFKKAFNENALKKSAAQKEQGQENDFEEH